MKRVVMMLFLMWGLTVVAGDGGANLQQFVEAAGRGDLAEVKRLFEIVGDPNAYIEDFVVDRFLAKYKMPVNALSIALINGRYDPKNDSKNVVKWLLAQEKIDVNAHKNNFAMSPLHAAVWAAQLNCDTRGTQYLLEKIGINVNARDLGGRTPLDLAIKYKCDSMRKLLLEHGAVAQNSDDLIIALGNLADRFEALVNKLGEE